MENIGKLTQSDHRIRSHVTYVDGLIFWLSNTLQQLSSDQLPIISQKYRFSKEQSNSTRLVVETFGTPNTYRLQIEMKDFGWELLITNRENNREVYSVKQFIPVDLEKAPYIARNQIFIPLGVAKSIFNSDLSSTGASNVRLEVGNNLQEVVYLDAILVGGDDNGQLLDFESKADLKLKHDGNVIRINNSLDVIIPSAFLSEAIQDLLYS